MKSRPPEFELREYLADQWYRSPDDWWFMLNSWQLNKHRIYIHVEPDGTTFLFTLKPSKI